MALKTKDDLTGKEVDNVVVSMSQAILAPLDALFRSQVHAARSFLNLILQIGYPDDKSDVAGADRQVEVPPPNKPFMLEFAHTVKDPVSHTVQDVIVKVPQLALVPLNTLAIDSAEFKMGLKITHVEEHSQMQDSRQNTSQKRPWFLVKDPVSLVGTISSHSNDQGSDSSATSIDIYIKLSQGPVPAALDNLLTSLTKSTEIMPINK